MIAVSHDRYFIDRVASRIVELHPEREDGCLSYEPMEGEGAFEAYLRSTLSQRATEAAAVQAAPKEGKQAYEEKKKKEAEERAARNRKAKAEKRAEELEEEIARLKEELFGPAASDYVRAAEIQEAIDAAEEELLALYEILL